MKSKWKRGLLSPIFLLLVCLLFPWNIRASSPGSEKLDLVVVSDVHLNLSVHENTWRLSKDSDKIFTETLKSIFKGTHPDLLLFTGDTFEGKGKALSALKRASKVINKLVPSQWFIIPGNHERRYGDKTKDSYAVDDFMKIFSGHGPHDGLGYFSVTLPNKPYTIIGLNTMILNSSEGEVAPDQKAWLERMLNGVPKDQRVIIFMHHPVVTFHPAVKKDPKLKIFLLNNHKEIQRIFERHKKNIVAVISGHTHTRGYRYLGGINYISVPSINSWPCQYARFSIDGTTLQYQYLPIPEVKKIREAKEKLVKPNDEWMKIFNNDANAVMDYFSAGADEGIIALAENHKSR